MQKPPHVQGYDALECGTAEREDRADGSDRADKREVFLLDRLRSAAVALNPGIPATVRRRKIRIGFTSLSEVSTSLPDAEKPPTPERPFI